MKLARFWADGRSLVGSVEADGIVSLSDRVKAAFGDATRPVPELRDYGVGAQILLDLGVHEMILLSNTKRTIVGLEGYGLKVVGQRDIDHSA